MSDTSTKLIERLLERESLDLSDTDEVRRYLDKVSELHHEVAAVLKAQRAALEEARAHVSIDPEMTLREFDAMLDRIDAALALDQATGGARG